VSLTIEFSGDSIADSPFARFSWTRAAVEWADEAGPMALAALKAEAPVGKTDLSGRKGGRLRDSIRYERETAVGSVTMIFTANVPYAGYVIEGTGPHVISASAARFLRYEGSDGQFTYSRQVQHPGTKANPFPERALGGLAAEKLREWFADAVQASAEGA
jgi:Bacteriophage HK97-gp10, putative tail-component